MTDRITYEEFREYLKEFNPAHHIYPERLSLTKEESEKAMAHLLVLLESFEHSGARVITIEQQTFSRS
jgi:hypothetical protein